MTRYVIRRILYTIPVVFAVVFVVFAAVRVLPGDPALFLAGEDSRPETIARIREELNLDDPIPVQFVTYLGNLVQGDLGRSLRTNLPVAEELRGRLVATLQLTLAGMAVAIVFGVSLGVLAAIKPYSLVDAASMAGALVGHAMPTFWLGLLLILVFAIRLQWLPAGGAQAPGSLILPAIALGTSAAGITARMTRSTMLEVINSDYVRTARAKGISRRRVILNHALRSALVPVVTIVTLQTGTLLGGAVITEAVFTWPGLGTLLIDSLNTRDYTVLQASIILFALGFALINLLADVIHAALDPRVRASLQRVAT